MPNKPADLLNLEQAAAYLCLHIWTLRRLAEAGEIPARQEFKDWFFSKEDLDRYDLRQTG